MSHCSCGFDIGDPRVSRHSKTCASLEIERLGAVWDGYHARGDLILELRNRISLLEAEIREHRNANWEGRKVVDRFDQQLYAVLQEDKP